MLRYATVLLLGASLIGCKASAEIDPETEAARQTNGSAQLAAYAASTQFPDAEASDDLRAAAVVDRKTNNIKIYNFSNQALRDVDVWVNGSFVRQISSIPAHGTVTIPRSAFYDASGRSLTSQQMTINSVQLADDDRLFNLQGPIME